jgi:hypothetical protein
MMWAHTDVATASAHAPCAHICSKATAWAWWSSARRTRARCSSIASPGRTSTSARAVRGGVPTLLPFHCCNATGVELWTNTLAHCLRKGRASAPVRSSPSCQLASMASAHSAATQHCCATRRGHDHHVDRHGAWHRHRAVLPGGRGLQLRLVGAAAGRLQCIHRADAVWSGAR